MKTGSAEMAVIAAPTLKGWLRGIQAVVLLAIFGFAGCSEGEPDAQAFAEHGASSKQQLVEQFSLALREDNHEGMARLFHPKCAQKIESDEPVKWAFDSVMQQAAPEESEAELKIAFEAPPTAPAGSAWIARPTHQMKLQWPHPDGVASLSSEASSPVVNVEGRWYLTTVAPAN